MCVSSQHEPHNTAFKIRLTGTPETLNLTDRYRCSSARHTCCVSEWCPVWQQSWVSLLHCLFRGWCRSSMMDTSLFRALLPTTASSLQHRGSLHSVCWCEPISPQWLKSKHLITFLLQPLCCLSLLSIWSSQDTYRSCHPPWSPLTLMQESVPPSHCKLFVTKFHHHSTAGAKMIANKDLWNLSDSASPPFNLYSSKLQQKLSQGALYCTMLKTYLDHV